MHHKRALSGPLFGSIVIAVALASSCGPTETTCEDGIGCVRPDGGGASGRGGTSGSSGSGADGGGRGGTNGNAGTAGSSGSGGTQDGGGTSGTAGTGGTPPCGGACSGMIPVCNEATNQCVQCTTTSSAQCSGATPVCKPATNTCVECIAEAQCATGTKRFCNTTSNTCVQCLTSPACTTATASRCDAGECKPCATNADCAHISGKGVCDAGECVQCTGKNYAACGTHPTSQKPLVCDSRARTCTTTKQERSTGLCGGCVSDAECMLGQLCVQQRFGTPVQDVGYFCVWKQGDTVNGAPADCATQGRPYVRAITNAMSIDRETANVCSLAVSTCVARNQFRSKDCASADAGNNTMCGFAPPEDAKCVPFGTGFRCTMRCRSDDDCPPGGACNTQVAEPYCEL
jgi:hypothetical protein